jgi:hypothetical protein
MWPHVRIDITNKSFSLLRNLICVLYCIRKQLHMNSLYILVRLTTEGQDYEMRGSHSGDDVDFGLAPCGLVSRYQRFGGKYCHHLQVRSSTPTIKRLAR